MAASSSAATAAALDTWWDDVNNSPLWWDRTFHALAALYGVIAVAPRRVLVAGVKKAEVDTTTEHNAPREATTPRTRAAVAREKAQAAAREAEAAQAAARHAAEVAEAAAREAEGANRSVVARDAAATGPDVAQATKPLGPTTKRRLAMETTTEMCLYQPPKKMTPRKKQLATKVTKDSPTNPPKQ
ncbi:uncharacterized protein LOC112873083 [Panicum hallii]|uniref:uncharacterized protein LOC112873083 n=1 Tax=Panicum hallii TaxID=206008 RepID=UPI000DF4D4EA|nr:uncharacterized protein LOC112873083 [Panicum hallii]